MITSAFHISKRILTGILLPVLLCMVSCTADEMFDLPDTEEASDYIRIGAEVQEQISTRGYKPFGPVDAGNFVLTYPFSQRYSMGDTIYTYELADVKFGTLGVETMGFVTYMKEGELTDLKWSDVSLRKGTPGSAVFYLDNVSPELNDDSNTERDRVVFRKEGKIPFQAGRFDEVEGTNDLLWGTSEAVKNAKKIDFTLHHNMSRVRVIINVKPRGDNGAMVDLSEVAKLEITNLYVRPEEFDRTTGNLILSIDPEDTDSLPMVSIGPEAETIPWSDIKDDESVDETEGHWKAKIYTTYDFVLPPQNLSNESDRPKLRLTIPAKYAEVFDKDPNDDVIFEAFLPQNMYLSQTDTPDGEEGDGTPVNRRPMPFSFLKEHRLTIRATVGPPEMNLQFAPVYVDDWTDMGEHSITGQQAGIYNNKDFFDFLECYKAGDKVLLEKYGYKSVDDNGNEKWVFMFWSRTISLKRYDDDTTDEKGIENYLKDYMHDDIPFTFSFNNYVLKVEGYGDYTELSGAAGQIRLYNWLTGMNEALPGIKDEAAFKDMMAQYNKKSTGGMQKYGAYDNTNEQWVFEITEDAPDVLTFTYDELHNMMDFNTGAGNFTINLRGHKVKVTGLPYEAGEIVLSGTEGEELLHAILAKPEGIYSPEDVDWLIKAYNLLSTAEKEDDGSGDATDTDNTCGNYLWVLEQYGKQAANGSWTFTFIKSMELYGPDIYGTMIPDTETGLPDYAFSSPSVTVKVSDGGTYVYTPGVANLKKLFSAGGKATTAAELRNVITYANNGNPIYRRYYGKYKPEEKQWEYPITNSFEIPYSDLFKKLTSADPMELIIVGEAKVTVTGLPNGYENIICRGKQGAEILYNIMRGTYTLDDYPEPGIETPGDFTDMIDAYNSNAADDLRLYGDYMEEQGKWVFRFTPTAAPQIEVSYNALYGKMRSESGAGDFAFNFGDRSVKVTDLPDGAGDIVLSGAAGETLLHTILTAPESISSPEEAAWLIKAYNAQVNTVATQTGSDDFDWILDLFGTKESGKWTFTFNRTLLNGPDIYGTMIPDGSDKPDYTFTYAPSTGVMVADDTYQEAVSPANLKKLFAESGCIASATDFAAMADCGDHPIFRRYYGKPNPSTRKWDYTVTATFDAPYASIAGKLASLDDFDLHLEDEVVVTLTNLPRGYRPIVCRGDEGAETLYQILRGTYPVPEPGIESEADIDALIAAYGIRSEDMWIYGTQTGSRWTFYVRRPLELNGEAIFGKMTGTDYDFLFDPSVTVKVNDGSFSENVDAEQLRKLFSNGGKITSAADLDAMIACGDNTITRRFYGVPGQPTWTYPVTASFSLDYTAVYGALSGGDDFAISIASGATITVTGLPGGRQIECDATALHDILRGTYTPASGIMLATDISRMTAAYPGNETELAAYGTKDGSGKWTFKFLASMTLSGDDVFGKMTGDYAFDLNGKTVKVKEGAVEQEVDAAQLKTLFSASGKINGADDLRAVIRNAGNTVTRRLYGTYNGSAWTFPVAEAFSIAYSEVNGKLSGETFNITYDNNFVVTVTGLPGSRQVECDAATLHDILLGTYTPASGIMLATDIPLMTAAYPGNETELAAYGAKDGGRWTFKFLAPMTLPGDDVFGKMAGDYAFDLNGNTVKVKDDAIEQEVDAAQLKTLFSASGKISGADDLRAVISNADNGIMRRLYGTCNGSVWTFPVAEAFSIAYSEIDGKLSGETINITYDNNFVVTVTGLPGGRQVECAAATLRDMLLGTYTPVSGIEQPGDIAAMTAAYNAGRTEDLQVYGTTDGSRWTFKFLAPMTLSGNDVFGKMIPGGSNPDYTFEFASSANVTVSDGAYSEPMSAANLKTLFSESGAVSSKEALLAMIACGDNTITRRYYGKKTATQWVFPITVSFEVAYTEIFGQLTSSDAMTLNIAGGEKITVALSDGRTVVCEGAEGNDTLYQILKGTYTPEPSETGGGTEGGDPGNGGDVTDPETQP